MKILYHHRIASKDGQYVHIEALTKELARLGHELVFVAPGATSENSYGAGSDLVSTLREKLPGQVHELLEFTYCFYDFLKLAWAILTEKPDVIYERYNLFLPSGIWAKKLFRIPLLLEINAPLYAERKKHMGIKLDWLARWSERYAWKNADYALPVSQVLAGYVQREGVADDRIVVIHNGADPEVFYPEMDAEELRQKHGLTGRVVVGFVGFLREWHGLDKVVRVMSNHPGEWCFLVVGDGPAKDELQRQAQELGVADRLIMTGLVDRELIPGYVALFDIALQPDVVAYASPLKMFEYMAAGKAILSVDSDNIREILNSEEDALLFSKQIDGDFESNLTRLLEEPEFRKKLGQSAVQKIQAHPFLWSHNAVRVERLFKGLINQNVASAGTQGND